MSSLQRELEQQREVEGSLHSQLGLLRDTLSSKGEFIVVNNYTLVILENHAPITRITLCYCKYMYKVHINVSLHSQLGLI